MHQAADVDVAVAVRSARVRAAAAWDPPPHVAALVGSDDELLADTLPYVEEGLHAGDLVVLACPPRTAALISGALGERAGAVETDARLCLLDASVPDAATALGELVRRATGTGSGRLRLAGQVQFGPAPRNWREGLRYEAAMNELLSHRPVSALCLYDRRVLPADVLAGAGATHASVLADGRSRRSPEFRDPADFVRELPLPREAVEDAPPVLAIDDAPSLAGLRRHLRVAIGAQVRDRDQAADLHLAVSEIAANAFRHGGRPVSARLWADAERIVCTVTDRGRGLDAPFAGIRPAHGPDLARGGMGLWLARKLWDHVDLLPAAPGLTVRLSSRLR